MRGFGGSDEREARLTQQRDYAAQLQEQVRAKQAQIDQEKARRHHEQQRERELVDALVQQSQAQQVQRPPAPLQFNTAPPQQQQTQQQQPHAASPVRSPQRQQQYLQQQQQQQSPHEYEVPHGSALLPGSPSKLFIGESMYAPPAGPFAFGSGGGGGGGASMPPPLVATFAPGPSIFDSLLQSESNRGLTSHIEALQSLRLEVEAAWKQRRFASQAAVSKSSFILVPSPTTSTSIPLSFEEKRQLDHEIDLSSFGAPIEADEPELMSGLLGESVLIPLAHSSPAKHPVIAISTTASVQRFVPASPPRSNSAVHRRLAAATAAAASAGMTSIASPSTATTVLRHESELLHFEQ